MSLQEINMKVVSYCDIPEELVEDHWLSEGSCDSYIPYSLSSNPKYGKDELDKWLEEEYPELIDTSFLIHLDY